MYLSSPISNVKPSLVTTTWLSIVGVVTSVWFCLTPVCLITFHTVFESRDAVSFLLGCFPSVWERLPSNHCHWQCDTVKYGLMLFFPSSQEETKYSHTVLIACATHSLTSNVLIVQNCFRYAHVYLCITHS